MTQPLTRSRHLPRRTPTDVFRTQAWVVVVLLKTGLTIDELGRLFPEVPFLESRSARESPGRMWHRWVEGHLPRRRYCGMNAPEYVEGWPPAAGALAWYNHPFWAWMYSLEALLLQPAKIDWVLFCHEYSWRRMESGNGDAVPSLKASDDALRYLMNELMI